VRIAYSMLLSFPVVGDRLVFWVFGGGFPTGDVVPRFFVFHVLLMPGLIIGAVTVHLVLLVRQKHTQFPHLGIDGHRLVFGKPLWPAQFGESITLMLWVGGLLAAAAVLIPWSDVTLLGPYVPGEVPNNAQPDWFMFWIEGALRIVPGFEIDLPGVTISGPFIAGIILPGLVFTGLMVYPFIERKVYNLEGDWHVLQNPLEIPLRAAMVVGTFLFILILSAAATNDILSRLTGVPIELVTWFFRITTILVPALLSWLIWRYSRRRLARREIGVAHTDEENDARYAAVPLPEAHREEAAQQVPS
jgi:ubiquinol-cytochrome c reductase cytochrome b subunit